MFAKTYGSTTLGVDGVIIDVEVDVSNGLPGFDLVGLPDPSVKESRERVRTAIKNAGIRIPAGHVTINLAPADIRKDSSGLDLPMAIALLAAYGLVPPTALNGCLFAAELSLEGELRGIHGILPMAIQAKRRGFSTLFTAPDNANEALLVEGIRVYALPSLSRIIEFLNGRKECRPAEKTAVVQPDVSERDDFADVQGQFLAKRAFEIAAAGGHNLLLIGAPGSGKTMLARRMPSILPAMTPREALEVTKIYSIAGLLRDNAGLMEQRPFRSPHHTTSAAAMIGGGSMPRPGEVTLSHHGVLFLDELPEFGKSSLEALRQPLEDSMVTVSRVHASLTFPASFVLIAAMNPCPCGYQGDSQQECTCTPNEIRHYTRKISGPLLDRIDIHIRVPRVAYQELVAKEKAESSACIRERVSAARDIQLKRLEKYHIFCNAQMNHAMLRRTCPLTEGAQRLLAQVFQQKSLSARSYDRIIKVSRTIADLAGSRGIEEPHIAEAVQLRNDIGLQPE